MRTSVVVLALFVAVAFGSNSALATITYSARACTQSNPCTVTSGGTTPLVDPGGPTDQDFVVWIRNFGVDPPDGYEFGCDSGCAVGENRNGYVYGHWGDPGGLFNESDSFVWFKHQLLCCFFDDFVIFDLNDNNLFVGQDLHNYAGAFEDAFIGIADPNDPESRLQELNYNLTPASIKLLSLNGQLAAMDFITIDNHNRILANCLRDCPGPYFQYELDPVPEPSTLALFGVGLAIAAAMRRRQPLNSH